MRNLCLLFLIIGILSGKCFSQVSINTDGSQADPSAILDSKSTTKGVLIPRMTQTQILAIPNPADGLQVYCTTDSKMYIFVASANQWKEVAYGTGSLMLPATYSIGTGGSCSNTTTHGLFYTGLPLSINEYVTILVSVSNIGSYSILSNSVNGYSFSATGSFYSTGSQTVNLVGTGTPVSAQTDNFTVTASNGGGTCTFSITVQVQPPSCISPIQDPRDGKFYNTVLIGTQCWMAQNLNIGIKIPGSSEQTNHSVIEKYCYDDDEITCTSYGGLYQWDNMMQWSTAPGVQGICPTGWHLPSDAEWTILTNYVGGESVAGGKIKETGFTHWQDPNTGATNSSGFTALPGGYRYVDGYFNTLTTIAYFWSSSQDNSTYASCIKLYYDSAAADRINFVKPNGFSVRCIKD